MTHLRLLVAFPALFGWLLLSRVYEGLRHDGVLYFGQTLLHSRVPALRNDLFFAGGSQDRYSIYAHVLAPLYESFGYTAVHVGVLLASWLVCAGAIAAMLKRFQPQGNFWLWGLACFAVLSTTYGGGWIFSYSEPFMTARSFAEPLSLWGLFALAAGRPFAALALAATAALFHPLMALPVLALIWCQLISTDRRWLCGLAVAPLVLCAAAMDVPPWNGLTRTYDLYWWSLVDTNNAQVLLRNWKLSDALTVVLDLSVLLAVRGLCRVDPWRRLLDAAVITTVGLIALSAAAADILHLVLPTQLQLWRAHWISHLLAVVHAPWLVARLWQAGSLWRVSACALVLALLNSHMGAQHGIAALTLWGLCSLAAWRAPRVGNAVVLAACISILLCVLGLTIHQLHSQLDLQTWQRARADWRDTWITLGAFPTLALPCFALLLVLSRKRAVGFALATVVSGAILFASVLGWDRRSDLLRAVESQAAELHPFAPLLPAQASVYWPGQLVPVWGSLERISHYSTQQGAGLLFNHATAMLYGARRDLYRRIQDDHKRCVAGAHLARDREALERCERPALERLNELCQHRDAPDFLVLQSRLALAPLAEWQPPAWREPPQRFALYSCSQLTVEKN